MLRCMLHRRIKQKSAIGNSWFSHKRQRHANKQYSLRSNYIVELIWKWSLCQGTKHILDVRFHLLCLFSSIILLCLLVLWIVKIFKFRKSKRHSQIQSVLCPFIHINKEKEGQKYEKDKKTKVIRTTRLVERKKHFLN